MLSQLMSRRPDAEARLGLMGIFDVTVIHARTGRVKRHLHFKNLITDAGMNGIGSGAITLDSAINYLAVGTGSNAPAFSDVALQAELARTNSDGGFAPVSMTLDGSGAYYSATKTRLFTESQANGNLTELGFYNQSTSGVLFNRQLFKDAGNNPVTITKTNQDQLKVIFEYRLYFDTTVRTSDILVTGAAITSTFSTRSSSVQFWGPGLASALGTWMGVSGARAYESNVMPASNLTFNSTGDICQSTSWAAYTPGNFYRDVTVVWEPGYANFPTGVGRIEWFPCNGSGYSNFNMITTMSTKLPKDNTKRLSFTGRVTWARV